MILPMYQAELNIFFSICFCISYSQNSTDVMNSFVKLCVLYDVIINY
jgi:hypothetical protein